MKKDMITDLQDMRYLNWARTRRSSGTAGSFLKSYDDSGEKRKYYKLSDFDPLKGITGHECVNEIIVQRLLCHLGIEHLDYTLIHALVKVDGKDYETWLCESEDFRKPGERKITLEDYYVLEKTEGESPFDLCRRKGWERYIYEMFLIDYLVLNRDRHGANTEILRDEKSRTDRPAPLFDHGISLLCRCRTKEELERFDVMEDRKVQSFVGTGSALENVKRVPKDYLRGLPQLTESDLDSLFEGTEELIGSDYVGKMRDMIRERWCSLDRI